MLLYLSTRRLTWIWGANSEGKCRKEFQFTITNRLTSVSFLFLQKPLCTSFPDTIHYLFSVLKRNL